MFLESNIGVHTHEIKVTSVILSRTDRVIHFIVGLNKLFPSFGILENPVLKFGLYEICNLSDRLGFFLIYHKNIVALFITHIITVLVLLVILYL